MVATATSSTGIASARGRVLLFVIVAVSITSGHLVKKSLRLLQLRQNVGIRLPPFFRRSLILVLLVVAVVQWMFQSQQELITIVTTTTIKMQFLRLLFPLQKAV